MFVCECVCVCVFVCASCAVGGVVRTAIASGVTCTLSPFASLVRWCAGSAKGDNVHVMLCSTHLIRGVLVYASCIIASFHQMCLISCVERISCNLDTYEHRER